MSDTTALAARDFNGVQIPVAGRYVLWYDQSGHVGEFTG